MAAWAAVLFAFSACQDVVEVEDLKAKDDIPSNGAPEITKIVLANDKEFEIDGADFEDMVRIEGKNLGNVVSVKFNDVEVDPKEIYARYDMLLAPVPRQLPGEVTDMLYITTKNGSVSRPFTVSIPEYCGLPKMMKHFRKLFEIMLENGDWQKTSISIMAISRDKFM